MSNLQPNCCLKFDFQKVDQHVGGKWLIHDTKRRKDVLDKSDTILLNGWQDRTAHGANMGPTRADRPLVGPMLVSWTLLSRVILL